MTSCSRSLFSLVLLLLSGRLTAAAPFSADSAVGKAYRSRYDLGRFGSYRYERPRLFAPLRDLPGGFVDYGRQLARSQTVPVLMTITATTVFGVPFDQPLYEGAVRWADQIGLDHSSRQRTLAGTVVGPLDVAIRVPATTNSTLYWLGEGMPSLLTAGAFWVTGRVRHDHRALSTAAQLCENALATGLTTQLLKRVAGRQVPRLATTDGGRWAWFPSWVKYQKRVPNYDAFPSGHLTTLSATFTTLAENYPEYRPLIYPLGGAVIVGCGYAMVNTGVHWVGDYPLALGLGWSYAHFSARRHRVRLDAAQTRAAARRAHPWRYPTVGPTAVPGGVAVGMVVSF